MGKLPMPRGEELVTRRWTPAILRFIRRAVTIVSLICFLGVVTLWVHRRFATDSLVVQWGRHTDERWTFVKCDLNSTVSGFTAHLEIQNTTDPKLVRFYRKMPVGPTVVLQSWPQPARTRVVTRATPPWWNRIGFFHERGTTGGPSVPFEHVIGFPHWLLLPILSVMPLSWLRGAWKRRRWRRAGLCAKCGYDLRASPERCPECGAPIPPFPGTPGEGRGEGSADFDVRSSMFDVRSSEMRTSNIER
jgi:hypothetical protein